MIERTKAHTSEAKDILKGFCTSALRIYLGSAKCSPELEAVEAKDGIAETKSTVCEVGLCIKTVARSNDLDADVAGVRAGTNGVCANVAAEESCGEKTDTTNRDENFVTSTENVPSFVKATVATVDFDEKIVSAAAFDH